VGYKHVHEAPVPPHERDAAVPSALSAIVLRCLAKAPGDRYDRGFELADALLACAPTLGAPAALRGMLPGLPGLGGR
jgi:serine/threonine-protein kinase